MGSEICSFFGGQFNLAGKTISKSRPVFLLSEDRAQSGCRNIGHWLPQFEGNIFLVHGIYHACKSFLKSQGYQPLKTTE